MLKGPKYVLRGSKLFQTNTNLAAKKDPVIMTGKELEISYCEKYLWNWIHEDGTIASITTTINKRIKGLTKKIYAIIEIAESSMMAGLPDY